MTKNLSFPLAYPDARRCDQTDTYFGTEIADPYRWLEELDSAETRSWIEAENALTESVVGAVPRRAAIHARLLELSNYERFSMPRRRGARLFFTRNSGLQNQAVLYWQASGTSEPEVLLDPNTLSADGTVALNSYSVSEDGELLAYALSDAGSDVQRVRVKRVATGEDLPDAIEWMKFSGVAWARDGSGFYYSSFGAPAAQADGDVLKQRTAFHKLYFHALGTAQADDRVAYERPDDGEMLVSGGPSEDGRWLILSAGKGHTNTLILRDLRQPGREIALALEADAIYSFLGNIDERVWLMTNKDAARSRVVMVDLAEPQQDRWTTVVPERAESLESAEMVHDELLLTYLKDAQAELEQRSLTGALVRVIALPAIGVIGVGGGRRQDTEIFFVFTNYTTPATVYTLDLLTGESRPWRTLALQFDPTAFVTRLAFATSKDGTRVPLFITMLRDRADGPAPTLLYGYGGFGISLGPAYSSSRLAWMEMGGIYAEAILRGGGEYGEDWHQAGTKTRKQNVFDDFIACAEFLIAEGLTSAEKLAINGGSNGGLLAAACALARPELFAAAVPQVGVLDMLRFDKFTIGYAWKSEYGAPSEVEEEFQAILKYSPLHGVRAGVAYPPMLVMTGDHDDRVFPAHSFKFGATLQAAGAPALIRVETRGGHGAGLPLAKQLDSTADMYAFLVRALEM